MRGERSHTALNESFPKARGVPAPIGSGALFFFWLLLETVGDFVGLFA